VFPLSQTFPLLPSPSWPQLHLAEPLWLFALLLLPILVWLRRRRPLSVLLIPHAAAWAPPRLSPARRWPLFLGLAAFVLLVVSLARPQRIDDSRAVRGEGYDIVIAIDLSTSMFAEDVALDGQRVNRLDALRPVLDSFIRGRPSDRIGFVAFAGRAYTLAPLTHDHAWLARQVERLRIGLIEDGTAIGDGLGLSLTRLERARTEADSPRSGAFVILMTDGANNRGSLTPEQAAALAKARGVPVFTIGVGRDGLVPFPRFDEQGRRIGTTRVMADLDPAALRHIAALTGGRYFRAEDPQTAAAAFAEIDRASKITFQQSSQILATELFPWPSSAAAFLLLLAALPLLRRPSS
jgi:Ca-activated chloride channel homolog